MELEDIHKLQRFQLSFEQNRVYFSLNQLTSFARLFHPIRSKAKNNRHSFTSHELQVSVSRSHWFTGLSLIFAIRQSYDLDFNSTTSN